MYIRNLKLRAKVTTQNKIHSLDTVRNHSHKLPLNPTESS